MITDVEAGADIFCFALDLLARLVEAGALTRLSETTVSKVTAANDGGAVKAASIKVPAMKKAVAKTKISPLPVKSYAKIITPLYGSLKKLFLFCF